MEQVSVVIPNYNHGAFLQKRIDSVLNQTYKPFEVIILDDCSTDNSRGVIEAYRGLANGRIVYNTTNSGCTFKQWNKGISLATGRYLWIAESDDFADPQLLETLVNSLEAERDAGLAYCKSRVIDEKEHVLGFCTKYFDDLDPVRWQNDYVADGEEECRRFLIWKNTIPNTSAVLLRTAILRSILPIDTTFSVCGDWLTWIKVLLKSKVVYISKPLNYFRKHQSSVRALNSIIKCTDEALRVQGYLLRQINIPSESRDRLRAHTLQRAVNALLGRYGPTPMSVKIRLIRHAMDINPCLARDGAHKMFRSLCRRGCPQTSSQAHPERAVRL